MYIWQEQALVAWTDHSRVGVVEAVTGTGKTRVGIEAAAEAVDEGFKVVVCVPTLVLQDQWIEVLTRARPWRVGAVGGGAHDAFDVHDIIVGTVQTLSKGKLARSADSTMLIVDECHRAGALTFQNALDDRYTRRLGLTATFERSDDRLRDLKVFFEGEPVFNMGYARAVPEGIVAHYLVARVGVDFTTDERAAYQEADQECRAMRVALIGAGLPAEPFGAFMEATSSLAATSSDVLGGYASRYLAAFSRRASVLSLAQGKVDALKALAPAILGARAALLFTMRVAGAKRAAEVLNAQGVRTLPIHGESSKEERDTALLALKVHDVDALVAPRILDEGVDVPEADLGVIIATSSKRLQMIQRMGRILRKKNDGRRARFILLYVTGTAEDPRGPGGAHEAFFDAIEPTADAVVDFDLTQVSDLVSFLATSE